MSQLLTAQSSSTSATRAKTHAGKPTSSYLVMTKEYNAAQVSVI
jgi:hypothetical protein